jgi:hypothetical protein
LKLLETVDAMIGLLLWHPLLGRMTRDAKTRVISFGNFLLFYDETNHELHVLSFWDNRQNPKKRIDKMIVRNLATNSSWFLEIDHPVPIDRDTPPLQEGSRHSE